MALVTRKIKNTGDALTDSKGAVIVGANITFVLVNSQGRATDAWDAISGERVAPITVSVATDASGLFSVDLWPNDRGEIATQYLCSVDIPGVRPFMATLPSGATDLQWVDFMAFSLPISPADMQTILDQIAIATAAADSALNSKNAADADVILTHADVVLTHADVVLTHADVITTGSDKAATAADRIQTGLDRTASGNSAAAAAGSASAALSSKNSADADVILTHADVVLTHADVVLTHADVVLTGIDKAASAGSAAAAAGSSLEARDWATKTSGEVVTGQGYGAKKYALDAAASQSTIGATVYELANNLILTQTMMVEHFAFA